MLSIIRLRLKRPGGPLSTLRIFGTMKAGTPGICWLPTGSYGCRVYLGKLPSTPINTVERTRACTPKSPPLYLYCWFARVDFFRRFDMEALVAVVRK
jgi:hypothetical protein